MTRLLRRAAVALLATAAISGLAVPATASAHGDNHTQLEICNAGAPDLKFYIVGYNQSGDWVRSTTGQIPPYHCYWMNNWWWQTNHAIELHWEVANSVPNWKWHPVYIPGNVPDGGWQQATIYD